MKKKFLSLMMLIAIISVVSSQTVFDAIYNDDIVSFTKLIKKKKNLEGKTELGMPVQLAIAQFSDENFEVACEILSKSKFDFDKPSDTGMTLLYLLTKSLSVNKVRTLLKYNVNVNKKVDEILPIQATQFSTYPFHTKQKINPENYIKEKEIHEMLLEKGSEPFSYIQANLYYFGNFLYAFATTLFQSNRMIKPKMLNEPEFFDINTKNNRTIASFRYEVLKDIFKDYGLLFKNVEISNYTENIIDILNEVLVAPERCFVLIYTGKSLIAPNQWVMLKKLDSSIIQNQKISNGDEKFYCSNSDSSYDYAEYHIKDISEIIVIKVLGK